MTQSFLEFLERALDDGAAPPDLSEVFVTEDVGSDAFWNAYYEWVQRIAAQAGDAGYEKARSVHEIADALAGDEDVPVFGAHVPMHSAGPRGATHFMISQAWLRAVQLGFDRSHRSHSPQLMAVNNRLRALMTPIPSEHRGGVVVAAGGAALGFAVAGPPGAVVGAVLGFVFGR